MDEAKQADVDAAAESSYSSGSPAPVVDEDTSGTLASDEALQALREKLTGG